MEGKVSIKIDADGNATFEVTGAPGTACETLTEALIRGLGDVEEQRYTEEYCQELPDYVETHTEDE